MSEATEYVRDTRILEDFMRDARAGRIDTIGEVTLTTGGSTTVNRLTVSRLGIVLLQALSPTASNAQITRVEPQNGSFVIYHAAGAADRVFRYIFFGGMR